MVGLHGLQMRKLPTIQLSSSGLRILCSLEIRFGPFAVLEWIRPLIIAQYHQGKQFLAPHDHQIVGLVDFNGLGCVHWAEIQSLSNQHPVDVQLHLLSGYCILQVQFLPILQKNIIHVQ